MIRQDVITVFLIGAVLTGVIPIIGTIVLLVMGKIKGSSFWAGVLAYIIGFFISAILAGIISIPFAQRILAEPDFAGRLNIISDVAMFIIMMLAMGFCISVCMKYTRTFKGGISCGLGFGMGYAVTSALGFISSYSMFAMINSGEFDRQYKIPLEQGLITKEQFAEAKAVFTGLTAADGIMQMAGALGIGLVFTASGAFIMRAVCRKNTFMGIFASMIISAAGGLSTMIPNAAAASVIPLAIGAAALIFALRMKDEAASAPSPAAGDDFLDSIRNAKDEK